MRALTRFPPTVQCSSDVLTPTGVNTWTRNKANGKRNKSWMTLRTHYSQKARVRRNQRRSENPRRLDLRIVSSSYLKAPDWKLLFVPSRTCLTEWTEPILYETTALKWMLLPPCIPYLLLLLYISHMICMIRCEYRIFIVSYLISCSLMLLCLSSCLYIES